MNVSTSPGLAPYLGEWPTRFTLSELFELHRVLRQTIKTTEEVRDSLYTLRHTAWRLLAITEELDEVVSPRLT